MDDSKEVSRELKPDPWQNALKRLGPEGKLKAATKLYFMTRKIKETKLRELHPEWSDSQIHKAVNEWMWYARD